MDTYTIKKAYHWTSTTEIEITSENLIYTELCDTHSGCQNSSTKNSDEIHKKCVQVADLIREIDKLNK